jgi:hypothetical protein
MGILDHFLLCFGFSLHHNHFGCILQPISQSVGQWAKTNTSEEVDSVSGFSGIIFGKYLFVPLSSFRVICLKTLD